MTEPHPPQPSTRTPLWVNLVAVGALALFVAGGAVILKHLSGDETPIQVTDKITPGGEPEVLEGLAISRPGGRPVRSVVDGSETEDPDRFRALAESDPMAAASAVARLEDNPLRDDRLKVLMLAWVEIDAQQAADWVIDLPVGSLKTDATAELGLAWGAKDPIAASIWVEENIFTQNAPAGAASLTSAWARLDIEAASEWVNSLDIDTPARRVAVKTLAFHLGTLDPQRGLQWLAQLDPIDRNMVAVNFAASWSNSDPQEAANWIRFGAANLEGRIRDQASLTVLHGWTAADPEAASSWITGLGAGALKEDAKVAFAETHAAESPPEALAWAQSIDDPSRRLETTMNVYEEWVTASPEEFKTVIRESIGDMDETLRHELYDLLLDHDREFKDELFRMLDERAEP